MNKTLEGLEEELFWLRKECYFNRGTMPLDEWRRYHPRIDALKKQIEKIQSNNLAEDHQIKAASRKT